MNKQAKRWDDWAKRQDISQHVGVAIKWSKDDFIILLKKYVSKDKEALEIGCGSGRISVEVASLLKHIYATDPSLEMLKRGKILVSLPNVSFHLTDGYTLKEFKDSSMDIIYSHEVFHLITIKQVYAYFKEIKRILKNKGIAVISLLDFVSRFDSFKEGSLKLYKMRELPTITHSRYITEEMIGIMLADLDMEVIKIERHRFLKVVFKKKGGEK